MPPVRLTAEHAWIRPTATRTGVSYHLRWICPIENRWMSRYVADTIEGAEAARAAFLDGALSFDLRPTLSGRRLGVRSSNKEYDVWLGELLKRDEVADAKESLRALCVLLRHPDHLRLLKEQLGLGKSSPT